MRGLSAAIVAFWIGAMPSAAVAELYGAITFSPSTGMAGTAWNFPLGTEAESEAMRNCGQADCDTLAIFSQCGALAVGDGNAYGYGYDLSLNTATDIALQNCDGYGSNCEITAAFCNEGY